MSFFLGLGFLSNIREEHSYEFVCHICKNTQKFPKLCKQTSV